MARKTFFCVDAHTCGNPVRVVAGGGPFIEGKNMSEKRQNFMREYDWIRRGLMFEPRGHDMMSGSILFPPSDPQNDCGILFIETSGCLPMCGHGTIGTVTVAIEEGLVSPKNPGTLRLETPAGLVKVSYVQEGKKVKSVKIVNIKSYLAKEDISVDSDVLGELKVDVVTETGLDELLHFLKEYLVQYSGLDDHPLITRKRHRNAIEATLAALEDSLNQSQPLELRSESLRIAGDRLGTLIGRIDVEDLLDVIFSEFCVGK